MKNLGSFRLVRGEKFEKTFYLGTYKDIVSSTDDDPSVLLIPAHDFDTATDKQITGHKRNLAINNTEDNPFHEITVIDENYISVPIEGIANGEGGTILTPADITGVTCQWRKYSMDTETAAEGNVLFEPDVTEGANGAVTISVEQEDTFKDTLTLDKYRADILVGDTYYAYFDIEVVKSVTR